MTQREIGMIDGQHYALDETYDQFFGWDNEHAYGQALATYVDFKETICDALGMPNAVNRGGLVPLLCC